MVRIGVVGDLSLQDPARLEYVMGIAYADADLIINVGDMHPGYSVVKKYTAMSKSVYAIPGNHDMDWDTKLGWPRQWHHDIVGCHLIGLDNSQDTFCAADWNEVATLPNDDLPIIIFVHKPLSMIVLPDGSESNHIMGDGVPNADAEKLKSILKDKEVLYVHGHYHGWSFMKTDYGDCLIEGRGGAAPQLGYSIITVNTDGLVLHSINL